MAHPIMHLKHVEFLAGLPASQADLLARVSEVRHYRDGERLFSQGDRLPGIYVVLSGSLKVFRTDGRGKLQVLDFLHAGQCIGEVAVFDGQTIASSAETHGETQCCLIPGEAVRDLAHRDPVVAEVMIQHFAAKVRHLVSLVEQLSLHSVPERVAQLLLERLEKTPGRHLVEFEETQEELAQCIGASREAFSRALRLLSDLGLVQSTFPVVRIEDTGKLARYARG